MALQLSRDWMNKEDKSAPFIRQRIEQEEQSFETRVRRFQKQLGDLYSCRSIATLAPRIPPLEAEYADLWHTQEWVGRLSDLHMLVIHKDRLATLKTQDVEYERQIAYYGPGGEGYKDKMMRINESIREAQEQRTSISEHQRQLGEAKLAGCDKETAKLRIKLTNLKAELKAIRGD